MIVVYKDTCKCCGKFYIGNKQQHLKDCINQHCDDVRRLVNYDKASDSFAKHFAQHFNAKRLDNDESDVKISKTDVRKMVTSEILWQGKAIPTVKTFGKMECRLCMQERLFIYKAMKEDKINNQRLLINSGAELYGACRHKTKFHRLIKSDKTCTDEGCSTCPENSLE